MDHLLALAAGRGQQFDQSTALALAMLAAILPTLGTIVVAIISGLMSRSIRAIDSKLAAMDGKLDGHGDRLARVETRTDAQSTTVAALEQRLHAMEERARGRGR